MTDAALALPASATSAFGAETWIAVWTRARAEKVVAKALASRCLSVWLPTIKVKRRWSDRWKEVESVVFPGYLFARINLGEWPSLLRVGGVLTVVKEGRNPARIREGQMAEMRSAVSRIGETAEQPEVVHDFKPEQRVRVTEGPMAGLVGVVRQVRGKRRLLIGFEQIGRAVAISIGAASVQRCTD